MRVDQVFSVVFSKNPVGWQTSSCEVDEVGDTFGDTFGDTLGDTFGDTFGDTLCEMFYFSH